MNHSEVVSSHSTRPVQRTRCQPLTARSVAVSVVRGLKMANARLVKLALAVKWAMAIAQSALRWAIFGLTKHCDHSPSLIARLLEWCRAFLRWPRRRIPQRSFVSLVQRGQVLLEAVVFERADCPRTRCTPNTERKLSSDVTLCTDCAWNATVETMRIQAGYWRLSPFTSRLYKCTSSGNKTACFGGTAGALICAPGHEGPCAC